MSTTFLSVDLGNSRCKLCLWTIAADVPPELAGAHEIDSREGLSRGVEEWLAAQVRVDSAAVSSVASREIEDELCAALESSVAGAVERRPDSGLAIDCLEPDAVGRDRLFAARGAHALVAGSAIVVDAGTALTVDAVRVEPARAVFLGGAIAPGPRLLAEALARGTARLKLIEPRPGAHALGRDTETALQSGVVVGFRGAARELVERVSSEAGLESAPVVLTGGARRFLMEPSAFGSRHVREARDLVHRGLDRGLLGVLATAMKIEARELTAPGPGGISVVRVAGSRAFECVQRLAPRLSDAVREPQLVRLCLGDEDLDESLVCVFSRAEVELHLHGSPPLVARVLELVQAEQASGPARREDSTSPVSPRVEELALRQLAGIASDSGARILLDQADGALRRALLGLRSADAESRSRTIGELAERGRVARFALEPIEVVLAGPVNAGKSTLFNVLVGEDRVIVSDEAGTTRDAVRERAQLGAYPIFLTDTAGERESGGAERAPHLGSVADLERASQLHALRARHKADLVLSLARVDSAQPSSISPTLRSARSIDALPAGSAGTTLASTTQRARGTPTPVPALALVHTQLDRIDAANRARFPGAISAAHEPERARARIREIFQAVFELPDEPWRAGAAVPFDASLMRGVGRLPLDATPAEWVSAVTALLDAS